MCNLSLASGKKSAHRSVWPWSFFFLVSYLSAPALYSQEYRLQKIETHVDASFRGLSVVDNNIAWISGSKGHIGITTDGGVTWHFNQVSGFEEFDFRAVYAFDRHRAIIANAGSPAVVLVTNDGGMNWKTVYRNEHKDAFIDGIDFRNDKEGVVYGDPIGGKMLLLSTSNGGVTWTEINNAPRLEAGEASFAASGTGIRCTGNEEVTICTGGFVSRLWISFSKGERWIARNVPMVQGLQTTGIFSFVKNDGRLIIVGGDFKNDSLRIKHNFYSDDDGQTWLAPSAPTNGYRECVEAINKKFLLAVGPSGLDLSRDNGIRWEVLSNEKALHVVRRARKGSLIIAAGGQGRIFLIQE